MRRAVVGLAALLFAGSAEAETFAPTSGPTPETIAVNAGRGFSVSTGPATVSASTTSPMYMSSVLVNPAGSGCNALLTLRRIGNASTSTLTWTVYKGAVSAVSGSTSPTVGNRLIGATSTQGLTFSWGTSSSGFTNGTAGVDNFLYPNQDKEIGEVVSVPPGTAFGIQVAGINSLLTSNVTVSVTFVGYCQ